jgi:hypothetical protein
MDIVAAIHRLRPGVVGWVLDGNDLIWVERLDEHEQPTGEFDAVNLTWTDYNNPKPTKKEFEDALVQLEIERRKNQYQQLRRPEYPDIKELADAIYWQGKGDNTKMQEYLSKVEAVKLKYPKPEK